MKCSRCGQWSQLLGRQCPRPEAEVPKLSQCSKMMRSLVTFCEFPMRFHAHLVERGKNKERGPCLGLDSNVAGCPLHCMSSCCHALQDPDFAGTSAWFQILSIGFISSLLRNFHSFFLDFCPSQTATKCLSHSF